MNELWNLIGESKDKCSLIQEKKYDEQYYDLGELAYIFYNLGLCIINDIKINEIKTIFFSKGCEKNILNMKIICRLILILE